MSAPRDTSQTVTIANGASLSGAVDLGERRVLVGVIVSAAWTAAGLSFASSASLAGTYGLVGDVDGEVAVDAAGVAASGYVAVPPDVFVGVRYLKVRSGTSGSAVAQGAERILTLVTRELE